MVVTGHGGRTRLSRLLARVEAGEEIIIGRAGRPVQTALVDRADADEVSSLSAVGLDRADGSVLVTADRQIARYSVALLDAEG